VDDVPTSAVEMAVKEKVSKNKIEKIMNFDPKRDLKMIQ